jgi:hypothetical protein
MIGPTDLFHPSPAPHFKTFQVFSDLLPKASGFQHHIKLCSKFKSNMLVKRALFLLNAAFAMAVLDLIS